MPAVEIVSLSDRRPDREIIEQNFRTVADALADADISGYVRTAGEDNSSALGVGFSIKGPGQITLTESSDEIVGVGETLFLTNDREHLNYHWLLYVIPDANSAPVLIEIADIADDTHATIGSHTSPPWDTPNTVAGAWTYSTGTYDYWLVLVAGTAGGTAVGNYRTFAHGDAVAVGFDCAAMTQSVAIGKKARCTGNGSALISASNSNVELTTAGVFRAAGMLLKLEVKSGTGAVVPAPTEEYEGCMAVYAPGPGIASRVVVCLMDADDAYKWFPLDVGAAIAYPFA